MAQYCSVARERVNTISSVQNLVCTLHMSIFIRFYRRGETLAPVSCIDVCMFGRGTHVCARTDSRI